MSRLRAGAQDAGATGVPVLPDEVARSQHMLDRSGPRTSSGSPRLGQRAEVFDLLERRGAVQADPSTVRLLVERARR